MPTYCYHCPGCHGNVEVNKSMSKALHTERCPECHAAMDRDLRAEQVGTPLPGNWPMTSTALGIHPDDVPDMMEFDKQMGVPTEYSPDGDPVLRDPKHRRDYSRAHDAYDRNAGYGDPAPQNR